MNLHLSCLVFIIPLHSNVAHLIDIASHLNQYENDPLLRSSVLPMKAKFAKY
jgi:hypothetical protein